MSDVTIPEDILAKAKAATGGWMAAGQDESNAALVKSVAIAIKSEREGSDVVERLKAACVGHPHASIPWPHRVLHDAIAEIERLRAKAIRSSHE